MPDRPPIDVSTRTEELLGDGPRTFFGVPSVGTSTRCGVASSVPFDAGTPQPGHRTGQRAGPAAARLASWE